MVPPKRMRCCAAATAAAALRIENKNVRHPMIIVSLICEEEFVEHRLLRCLVVDRSSENVSVRPRISSIARLT